MLYCVLYIYVSIIDFQLSLSLNVTPDNLHKPVCLSTRLSCCCAEYVIVKVTLLEFSYHVLHLYRTVLTQLVNYFAG